MQVVRCPSIYEKRAEEERKKAIHKYRFWPTWLCGGLIAIAIASAVLAGSYGKNAWTGGSEAGGVWAIGVLSMAFLARATGGSQGQAGEIAALNALSALPESFTAITNCKIPGFEKWGDVDILLIGPPGAVVIEVKNFQGHCRVEGEYWSHVTANGVGVRRHSVSGQLRGYIKAVNAYLARQGIACPVSGLIAINSNAWIEIAAPPPYPLIPYDRLKPFVEALSLAKRPAEIEKAKEALCSLATAT